MTVITLPADLEARARAEVEAGRAESVEALVAKALRERRAEVEYVRASWTKPAPAWRAGSGLTATFSWPNSTSGSTS